MTHPCICIYISRLITHVHTFIRHDSCIHIYMYMSWLVLYTYVYIYMYKSWLVLYTYIYIYMYKSWLVLFTYLYVTTHHPCAYIYTSWLMYTYTFICHDSFYIHITSINTYLSLSIIDSVVWLRLVGPLKL